MIQIFDKKKLENALEQGKIRDKTEYYIIHRAPEQTITDIGKTSVHYSNYSGKASLKSKEKDSILCEKMSRL